MKKAIVIGGTGLVGSELIKQLTTNDNYSQIVSLVRRRGDFQHPKLKEVLVDFDKPETYTEHLNGDVLFSCLGTTLRKAGSKDAQYRVDFEYQYEVAQLASQQAVKALVLVSSVGASPTSHSFYLNMKGQLDNAVSTLPFNTINIIRPAQLAGNRKEIRMFEKTGIRIMQLLNTFGIFKKYQPIHAATVAKAMINAAATSHSHTYTLNEVFQLSQTQD